MSCKVCGATAQKLMNAEINLHFPGYAAIDKPAVLTFPAVLVCLDCGFAEFSIPKSELALIKRGRKQIEGGE